MFYVCYIISSRYSWYLFIIDWARSNPPRISIDHPWNTEKSINKSRRPSAKAPLPISTKQHNLFNDNADALPTPHVPLRPNPSPKRPLTSIYDATKPNYIYETISAPCWPSTVAGRSPLMSWRVMPLCGTRWLLARPSLSSSWNVNGLSQRLRWEQ